jgi:hypothetical protein
VIGITGHTSGLGKALFDRHSTSLGFSRSNGYDITNPSDRAKIIDQCSNCDVFINNAYSGTSQVDLLYELYAAWCNTFRLIINISSNTGDGIKTWPHPYAAHKIALDKASQQLSYQKSQVRICNLRFGWLDTARVSYVTEPKISMTDACAVVDMVMRSTDTAMFTELTVLPKA